MVRPTTESYCPIREYYHRVTRLASYEPKQPADRAVIPGYAITRSALPDNYMKVTAAGYAGLCCRYILLPVAPQACFGISPYIQTGLDFQWQGNGRRLW